MKKITLLAIAAVAFSFASCKKDYTCTCTYTSTGSSVSWTSTTILKDASGKSAKANCANLDMKDASGNITGSRSCSLSK